VTEVSSQGVVKQTVSALSPDGSSFSTAFQHESGSSGVPPQLSNQYQTFATSATTNQIAPVIELLSSGGTGQFQYANVTIRYWFTEDGTQPLSWSCDFAVIGCQNITGGFVPVVPGRTGADHYFQIGFTPAAGIFGPTLNTGTMQFRLFRSDFSNMSQTNDYSFNGNGTSFTANAKITVYYNGALVYGTEPS
jgi:hypothetical protein